MCGIAGCLDSLARVDQATVLRMRDALTHRGPDDAGLYLDASGRVALAHRRLSIIDLSPSGHQPMCNEDESIWIVFNGEIYNFEELRAELVAKGHIFRSHSDTEAIVHLYEELGQGCVQRLRGMFAFAIWDQPRQRLLLARDRFGIKPLYYHFNGSQLLFASELKGLTANARTPRVLDQSSIYDFLSYRYVPAPKTIYQDVHKLLPAHTMTVQVQGDRLAMHLEQYWDIDFASPTADGPGPGALQDALAEAIQIHLISDVPVGVLLSGGVDSSLVSCLASQSLGKRTETFSVGFDVAEHSEAPYARQVAELLGTRHHEITASLKSLDDSLCWVVDAYDEPFADGSALPTHLVCELARRHVTVALSGDGGDEICAGYGWYSRWMELRRFDRFWRMLPKSAQGTVQQLAPGALKRRNLGRSLLLNPLEQYLRLVGAFTRYEKQQFLTGQFANQFADYDDVWQIRAFWREELDPLSRMQYVDIHTYLPDDILTKVDRASMAVSLEMRPPLLDHVVAEKAARLPAGERISGGAKKLPLKKMLRQWLPDELVDRRKQGFSVPWEAWLTAETVRKRLDGGALVQAGIVDGRVIKSGPDRLLRGGKAWTLLVLEEWYRHHG